MNEQAAKLDPSQLILPTKKRLVTLLSSLAIVVVLTQAAFQSWGNGSDTAVVGFSAYLVALVAAISLICGYSDDPKWLKWTSLFWVFVLINLQLFAIPKYGNTPLPIVAMYSSQFGLITTWMIMSKAQVIQRSTASIVAMSLLWLGASSVLKNEWFVICAIFLISLMAALWMLRFLGFRLRDTSADADGSLKAVQFGLRQAMLLTTALAILFGVLRSQGQSIIGFVPNLLNVATLIFALIALASVIVCIAACWLAVGDGHVAIMASFFLLTVLVFGGLTSYAFSDLHQKLMAGTAFGRGFGFRNWQFQLWRLARIEWLWIWWFVLSGMMLVASLLFFRSQGLRFARLR